MRCLCNADFPSEDGSLLFAASVLALTRRGRGLRHLKIFGSEDYESLSCWEVQLLRLFVCPHSGLYSDRRIGGNCRSTVDVP